MTTKSIAVTFKLSQCTLVHACIKLAIAYKDCIMPRKRKVSCKETFKRKTAVKIHFYYQLTNC